MKTRMIHFFHTCILSAVSIVGVDAAPSTPIIPVPDHRKGGDTIPIDSAPAPASECVAKVTALSGSAGIELNDTAGRITYNLFEGNSIGTGATITTGDSARLELVLPNGSVVHVGPNSMLKLGLLHCDVEAPLISFGLMTGSLWSKVVPATGGDIKLSVETENAVTAVGGATFLVETYRLDTVFHRRVIDMYPPEQRQIFEGLDTNSTADVPFEGNVTRVAVFDGSVDVTDRFSSKTVAVGAGRETIAGVKVMPMSTGPVGGRKGFNVKGEFKE